MTRMSQCMSVLGAMYHFLFVGSIFFQVRSSLCYKTTVLGNDVTLSWGIPEPGFWGYRVELSRGKKHKTPVYDMYDFNYIQTFDNEYKNRVLYNGTLSQSGAGLLSLVLFNITRRDAGTYRCWKHAKKIPDCGQQLFVLEKPSKPDVYLSKDPAVQGDQVTMTCLTKSQSVPLNHPFTLSYAWRKNGYDIEENDRYYIQGPNLTLRHVKRADRGANYSCRASEEQGFNSSWSSDAVLNIIYGPREIEFDPDSDTISIQEGRKLEVTCSVDCHPVCNVTWLDNSGEVVTTSTQRTVLRLDINLFMPDSYRCFTENVVGSALRKLNTNAVCIPTIRSFLVNSNNFQVKIKEKSMVSFETIVFSNPEPVVYLILVGKLYVTMSKKTQMENHTYLYTHLIGKAECVDHGMYYVIGNNTIGTSLHAQVDVRIICTPRKPENLSSTLYPERQNATMLSWSFMILAYPVPKLNSVYYVYNNLIQEEVTIIARYKQIQENVHQYTVDVPDGVSFNFGKYIFSFRYEGGERNISFLLLDNAIQENLPSPMTIVLGTCSALLIAVLVVISVHKCKRIRDKYVLRFAAYLKPMHRRHSQSSDDDGYATINENEMDSLD